MEASPVFRCTRKRRIILFNHTLGTTERTRAYVQHSRCIGQADSVAPESMRRYLAKMAKVPHRLLVQNG